MRHRSILCWTAPVVVAFAFAAPLVGCKKKPTKTTSSSTRDASEAVIDEDYRFKLEWPGGDWKLADEDEIARLNPDAVAGAMQERHFAAVIVESFPGIEGPAFARLVADNLQLQDKTVSEMKPMSFAGKDATAFEASGRVNGMELLFCVRTFVHQEFAYQILAWTAQATDARCSVFEPVYGAFSLLPGKVRSRTLDTNVADATGVGWRLRDGVFEDAATGIRLQQPEGWRVQVGDEVAKLSPDADVGLVYGDPEVYMHLISEVAPRATDELRTQLQANLLESGITPTGETVAFPVDGDELTFQVLESNGDTPMEFLHAVRFRDGTATQIQLWYVTGNRQQARAVVPQALASIGHLSKAETTALEKELAQKRDPQNAVGLDWAVRGGVYSDFGWGFRWQKPGPSWTIDAGQEDSRMQFEDRKLGLWGQIFVERSDDSLKSLHEAAAVNVFGKGDSSPMRVGKKRALRSDGRFEAGELEFSFRIVTADLANGSFVRVHLWGYPRVLEHEDDPAGAALKALTFSAEPAVSSTATRYVDRRLGFDFPVPAGWDLQEQLPAEARSVGTVPMWTSADGKTVGVLALAIPGEAATQDFLLDLLQQGLADRIGNQKEPKRTAAVVAGVDARRLEWPRLIGPPLVAFMFQRDRTSYGLLFVQMDEAERQRFLDGFRFTD